MERSIEEISAKMKSNVPLVPNFDQSAARPVGFAPHLPASYDAFSGNMASGDT